MNPGRGRREGVGGGEDKCDRLLCVVCQHSPRTLRVTWGQRAGRFLLTHSHSFSARPCHGVFHTGVCSSLVTPTATHLPPPLFIFIFLSSHLVQSLRLLVYGVFVLSVAFLVVVAKNDVAYALEVSLLCGLVSVCHWSMT